MDSCLPLLWLWNGISCSDKGAQFARTGFFYLAPKNSTWSFIALLGRGICDRPQRFIDRTHLVEALWTMRLVALACFSANCKPSVANRLFPLRA